MKICHGHNQDVGLNDRQGKAEQALSGNVKKVSIFFLEIVFLGKAKIIGQFMEHHSPYVVKLEVIVHN